MARFRLPRMHAGNVASTSEVHEPRRWPAYVLLPLGALSAIVGSSLLTKVEPLDVSRLPSTHP
jgi:hypothetical protein